MGVDVVQYTVGAVSLARRRRKIQFFKWLYLKNLLTFLQTVFFILFSMGPSYIGNILSFLSQIVFKQYEFLKGYFFTVKFFAEKFSQIPKNLKNEFYLKILQQEGFCYRMM
jgi:hypothetical protein